MQHTIQISPGTRNLAKQAAEDELVQQKGESRKDTWLSLADSLEIDGVPKSRISSTIIELIENEMRSQIKDPEIKQKIRFNNSWFFTVMSENNYIDVDMAKRLKGSDTDQYQENTSGVDIPDSIEFQILSAHHQLCKHTAANIAKLMDKLIIDEKAIMSSQNSPNGPEGEKRLEAAVGLINRRRTLMEKAVRNEYKNPATELKAIQKQLTKAKNMGANFDDRMTLMAFQKWMAITAVNLGYNKNEIARILGITTKHMRTNLYTDRMRNETLMMLEWFDRCPNPDCGIKLAEHIETMIRSAKNKMISTPAESPEFTDVDIQLLKPTGYQAEVLRLKKEINRLKRDK